MCHVPGNLPDDLVLKLDRVVGHDLALLPRVDDAVGHELKVDMRVDHFLTQRLNVRNLIAKLQGAGIQ